jgi:hypothetical protein
MQGRSNQSILLCLREAMAKQGREVGKYRVSIPFRLPDLPAKTITEFFALCNFTPYHPIFTKKNNHTWN